MCIWTRQTWALLFLPLVSSSFLLRCLEHSRSQYGEEGILIKSFWKGIQRGTYVELGAANGMKYSNTLYLATCLKWTGVLIEASKKNYDILQSKAKRRVGVYTTHYGAICTPPQTHITFWDSNNSLVGGDRDEMSASFKKRWHKSNGTGGVLTPCYPMSHYLQLAEVRHVDFFSLDVEGAELKVLQTINFEQTTVDIFMIELDDHDPAKNYGLRQLLFNLDYVECVDLVPRSGVFVKTSAPYTCPGENTTTPSPKDVPHPPKSSFFSFSSR